jgi:hypothetical protein
VYTHVHTTLSAYIAITFEGTKVLAWRVILSFFEDMI